MCILFRIYFFFVSSKEIQFLYKTLSVFGSNCIYVRVTFVWKVYVDTYMNRGRAVSEYIC